MAKNKSTNMLTKRGFIDVNKMAVRLQKIFPCKLAIAVAARVISLTMKDLNQFSDELILEFVKRWR